MVHSYIMSKTERGRLFPIRIDGTESVPFFIKKDKVIFGRGDNCDIRVYVDGVESEHCAVLFNREGEGFLDPLNKCGLTFRNGEIIEKQVSLYHNDVITIVKRSFRFLYPSSSNFCARSYQSASSLEDDMLQDFIDTDSEMIQQDGICQKRVTFGPTLSPEEFDKNLPPASPIRKGSLPCEKNSTNIKLSFERNLFKDVHDDSIGNDAESPEVKVPSATFTLPRLPRMSCTSMSNTVDQPNIDLNQSRPLFSEVLKKCPKEPQKDLNVKKIFQKSSPRRLQKKVPILQSSKQLENKSARHPRILAVGSTGHANSPETIIVCKKKSPESTYTYSVQLDKFQNEDKLKSPSSCSSRTLDGKNNDCSQDSEGDLSLPVLHNYCKQICHSIDKKGSFKNTEKNDQACSCASSIELPEAEENLHTFNREENINARERIASEILSASPAATEDGDDQSDEQNNFLEDNAMQQLYSHSSISSTISNESFLDICMNALKKLALTISMMSAFHMYNKVMEDMSNYSMYFPSTSYDSCNIKCDHRSNSQHNEGQMDRAKLALFQDMMRKFFSNSVSNKMFEEERCVLRSSKSNLNSDALSLCDRNNKKSNNVSRAPFKTVDSGCSPSECKAVCSHDNSVERKENNETGDESNLDNYYPCYQDSYETPILQCHTKSSQSSESSLNSSSSTSEYNPSSLTISSMKNISTYELSEYSNITQKKNINSKENDVPHTYVEKLNNVRNSFSSVSSKKKCMRLIRKSFPPTQLKRGKMSTKTISFTNDPSSENALTEDSIITKLRPRNLVAVKTKQRKRSLGVKTIAIKPSRKLRTRKRESCKSRSDFVKTRSCEDQSPNDHEQLEYLRIKKVKTGLEDDSVIPRITRATVKEKNIVISKSALKITSPVKKVANCKIARGINFEQVEMEMTKKAQVMRKNLKRSSSTSKRITRAASRKRNVKNVPSTSDIVETVEQKHESSAATIKRRKNESIKRKEPCKTTSRSELPKERMLTLTRDSENSRKRRIANNDENDILIDEKNKNNPRKVISNQVEVSPIQRITRSMMQKRKRREK